MSDWYVLGFSHDDIVLCGNDARLAAACVHAWNNSGRPEGCRVLQTLGESPHMLYWYLNQTAADLLDKTESDWRQSVVRVEPVAPSNAKDAIEFDDGVVA